MAELPPKWRSRGGDPFRQAKSLRGIKVTSPEAFLRIREATSLDEVQSILMSLPANVVVAGLDGEPLLRYDASENVPPADIAERETHRLLRQARVRGAKVAVETDRVEITFRVPEAENERYEYLKWHVARVTGRTVVFASPRTKRKFTSPRALLRSMLPDRCRLATLDADSVGESLVANIEGLRPEEIGEIEADFLEECGMSLDLKGQMSLF
jgi:hypothetical protein